MGRQDTEERHEDGADQEQEVLVLDKGYRYREHRARHTDHDREPSLAEPRESVLHRHGGGVHVREGLVGLVDGEDPEGEEPGRHGQNGGDEAGGVGGIRRDVGEDEDHTQEVEPCVRDAVADARPTKPARSERAKRV